MTSFADNLKTWRKARRFSQLDLANAAEISSRHLSFLETGRSNPSRDMIAKLGDALDLPLAARNQLLAHAGFAARYRGRRWDADEMAPVRAAVDHMLTSHAPFPGFAVDQDWTILQMNAPAAVLFGSLGMETGHNLIEMLLRRDVQAMIENWPDVAHHMAQRLFTESAFRGGVPAFDEAARQLAEAPRPDRASLAPVVPTVYRTGDLRLSLFSTIAQFGTPEDLMLDDLKIELFFPSDEETDGLLRSLAGPT